MTPEQRNVMNIELWQSIAAIADNMSLMERLTRYDKRLVKESNKKDGCHLIKADSQKTND